MNELEGFIKQQRDNSAGYHIILGQQWRRYGEKERFGNPLVYAAFEFRMAIERIIFELYALIKRLTDLDDKETENLGRINNVILKIMEIVESHKNLYKILRFNAILFDQNKGIRKKLAEPNIKKLKKYWHSLSDYCHMQIKPSETWSNPVFVSKGYELLNEVENYLWDLTVTHHFGFFEFDTIEPEVLELADKFVRSEIDEDALKMRLKILAPIVESRFSKRYNR